MWRLFQRSGNKSHDETAPNLDSSSAHHQAAVSQGDADGDVKNINLRFDTTKYSKYEPPSTGWGRVKAVFHEDYDYGFRTPEFSLLIKVTGAAFFVGFVIVGCRSAIRETPRFVKASSLKLYRSVREGQVRLSWQIGSEFFVRGFGGGLRYVCVSALFTTPVLILASYRNQLRFHDFLFGGIALGLYRWTLGIKAVFSTSIVGAFFALICAVCIYVCALSEGYDGVDELYQQYRQEYFRNMLQQCRDDLRARYAVEHHGDRHFWKQSTLRTLEAREGARRQLQQTLADEVERDRQEKLMMQKQQEEDQRKIRQEAERSKKSWWRLGF